VWRHFAVHRVPCVRWLFLPPLPQISSHLRFTTTATSLEIATDVYKPPHCRTRVAGGGKFSSRSDRIDVSTPAAETHFPKAVNYPYLLIYYVLWSTHAISLYHTITDLLISCICGSGGTVLYILNSSTRMRWVARLTPWPLWLRGTIPRCAVDRRLGRPDSRSGRLPKNKSASGLNVTLISRSSRQQISHYTNLATLGVRIINKVQKTNERMNVFVPQT
jgi:hypothetical protein